ncbi:hypothetical protein LIA77_03469 [Sarocladium implicatum]|nr:hypothetical protein LIA77_03469 [Sarocladium implicatum]
MREGLEHEKTASAETDLELSVASEWFIQAAPGLLRQCLEGTRYDNENDARAHRQGPLFKGTTGLDLEHWGFWKRRLEEVRPVATSDEVKAKIDEAVRCMTAAEKAFAEAELK